MDRSSKFLRKIFKPRIPKDQLEIRWSTLHISIFKHYFLYLSTTCDFGELPSQLLSKELWTMTGRSALSAKIAVSLAQELKNIFMVPKQKKFHDSENHIKKHQLVEAFISFLLQLLYHRPDSITGPCKDQIDNLEKELRSLLTVLGDTSFVMCDKHEEFQKLLAQFEVVANEAGGLVHSLFIPIDRAFGEMDKGVAVFSDHIDLLKANIMNFLDLVPLISGSIFETPKTSVVDSLLIVDSLIYDLDYLMEAKYDQIAGVKDQIKILHQGLISLQSSIKHVGSPQPSEIRELNETLMRIGDVAHEAEYLVICFLVRGAPRWYLINRLTDVNRKIEFIGTELHGTTKNYKFGGLKDVKYFSAQQSVPAKRNTDVDDVTVGFEDRATYILDKLVGGAESLQVISVFGMPGIGKTNLAKKLYNHPMVNCWFDKLSWCVVSQSYSRQSLLTDILIHIANDLGKERILKMEEESLVEYIYKTLKGRRYLIVMDDIWDSNIWDELLRCFPDDGNGSRIFFTTRNKEVAPPNSIIYAMPSLTNDQCWELLEKKVFDSNPCPPELLGVGKKIAANCGGLPLAVVVIAGILSNMDKEESIWEEVGRNLASYIFDGGDNTVMRILELSYKRLPQHLKPCFLYFGAFRKDKEIPAGKLTRLWIAEGFIHKEKDKNVKNVAKEYLMELIDKSLVMIVKRRSDGGIKTCVIHDLLRDLCLKTCEEENFLKFVDSEYCSNDDKSDHLQALECSVFWSYCQFMRCFDGHRMMLPHGITKSAAF